MPGEYRHNHYVPIWYQKRFMLPDQTSYYRLDLNPDRVNDGRVTYTCKDLVCWGPRVIFAENDLYTTQWAGIVNTHIERFFFGDLDSKAGAAIDSFANFEYRRYKNEVFQTLIRCMSLQKLRTPKGFEFVRRIVGRGDKNDTLALMQRLQQIFCAIWTECVWQIADASQSPTKFIISDHPVTVYNRACPPGSSICKKIGDPDIRMHATHTYYPLSLDKVLILTNLSWARNPYQPETGWRPNPNFFREAMFNLTEVQTKRTLSEDEVLQINYITKQRAHRYIASAEKEWLYPERRASTTRWQNLGSGYLLMPEPRLLFMGGELFIGYKDGTSDAFSEYGHKPWQQGYTDGARFQRESSALDRFQAEWAKIHGPVYTAENLEFGGRGRLEDSDDTMADRRRVLARYRTRRDDRKRQRGGARASIAK